MKTSRHLIDLLVFFPLCGILGCASPAPHQPPAELSPTQPATASQPLERRLALGLTRDQVRAALGEPNDISIDSNHLEAWTYSSHAKSLIPYYSFGAGEFYHLVVCFDKQGRVRCWLSN